MPALAVCCALEKLELRFPSLHRHDSEGSRVARRRADPLVNALHMREQAGLGTVLEPGDVITILPAVSGG